MKHCIFFSALLASLAASLCLPSHAQDKPPAPPAAVRSESPSKSESTPRSESAPTDKPPAPPAAVKTERAFSGEPLVIEQSSTIYRFAEDGTGAKTFHARVRIQSEASVRQYGVLTIAYAAGNEDVEMHFLRVHKADGSTVETPAADAQDMPAEVTRLAPFYSDLRQKQYPIRSLGVGDTLEYEGVIRMTKALATDARGQSQFWGAETFAIKSTVVALDESIELHVPKNRALTVVCPRHKPAIVEAGEERVYHWHDSQLKPTVPPPGAAKDKAAKTDDTQDADPSDGLPDIAWTSFKDWAAVGDWYRSLATDRAAATPELKAKAAALTEGATTDEEKVRRIYNYVSENIRYIGVAFGIGRYQPHAAGEVLANQYGDCKDKHTLLAALLGAAGFEASPVLIGSGLQFDRDVPAPSSFNHVITTVTLRTGVTIPSSAADRDAATHPVKRVWLDSTAEVAPYGMLSSPLRDKDALLVSASGPSVLVKTPADLPFQAFDHWESHGTLDKDGKLTGHFDVTMRGDFELMMRWGLRQTTAAQWQQLGQNVSSSFGFGGTVSNFTPGAAEQTNEPLHYSYDYERDTYGDWPNHRILSLIPYGLFATAQLQKEPSEPIPTGSPRLESARSVIHLPDGFKATLPPAVHIQSSFANYDVTYAARDGDVICETKLEVRTSSLPAGKWEEYNTFAKNIQDNSEIYVQLHGPDDTEQPAATVASSDGAPSASSTAAGAASPNGSVSHAGAETALREAWERVQARDLPGAQAKIEEARKLNPEQQGLWATAAAVAGMQNRQDEAETDLRKELALYPENEPALRMLMGLQLSRKERPQAIETSQKLLKIKPNDPGLTLQLGAMLTLEKRYPEALTLLQAAALKNPGNKQFILQLGRTQLAAGRTEEAVATLHTALEDTTDPLVLNDAAYELASHQADLPLAETSARKALSALDAEAQKFTLAEVTPHALGRANLIPATWDTLGWIEFEKGDLKEAEGYLAAAWATSQHPEVGYHLGRLYEKQSKPQQAYDIYRQANAALHGATFVGSDDLPVRMAALEKGGAHARPGDPGNLLGEERTYTLPMFTKKQASGDYYLLLSAGKVEGASWIEGAPELKEVESKLAAGLQPLVTAAGKPTLFPAGSGAKLVRRGVLSCSPMLHSCMLALMLPQDVRLQPKPPASSQVASQ